MTHCATSDDTDLTPLLKLVEVGERLGLKLDRLLDRFGPTPPAAASTDTCTVRLACQVVTPSEHDDRPLQVHYYASVKVLRGSEELPEGLSIEDTHHQYASVEEAQRHSRILRLQLTLENLRTLLMGCLSLSSEVLQCTQFHFEFQLLDFAMFFAPAADWEDRAARQTLQLMQDLSTWSVLRNKQLVFKFS